MRGEVRRVAPADNEGVKPVQPDLDSTSFLLSHFRLSPTFSLSRSIAKAPYAFEITAYGATELRVEPKAQILRPPSAKPGLEHTLYASSLVTLTALNIADIITTMKALKLEGLKEGNPVMQPIVKNVYLFSAVKLGVAVVDFILLKKLFGHNKKLGWAVSLAANLAMSYVVATNIRRIRDAR